MGKTFVKVKMWNFMDEEKIKCGDKKPLEIEAQIDNRTVTVVPPKKISDELNLIPGGEKRAV